MLADISTGGANVFMFASTPWKRKSSAWMRRGTSARCWPCRSRRGRIREAPAFAVLWFRSSVKRRQAAHSKRAGAKVPWSAGPAGLVPDLESNASVPRRGELGSKRFRRAGASGRHLPLFVFAKARQDAALKCGATKANCVPCFGNDATPASELHELGADADESC